MPVPLPDHRSDIEACRTLIRGGSRTFYAASFLLPRRVRAPAYALYAFCRQADDAIDGEADPRRALDALHDRLDRAYDDCPRNAPVDRAFADTVRRFHIPMELPLALLEGFAWDTAGRRYTTLSEVIGYAARVAGSVGAMMALLMGRRDPDALARATDLGIAMQLTNIARDVGEDARAGRLYLPLDWLHEAGIDPAAFLARPAFSPALADVVESLLRVADGLYERAESGIARLPYDCRPGILAARLLYADIGRVVAEQGYDSISRRAVVSSGAKLRRLGAVLPALLALAPPVSRPPLLEARFLVDAVPASEAAFADQDGARRGFGQRIKWLIDLFEQLERRDRLAR